MNFFFPFHRRTLEEGLTLVLEKSKKGPMTVEEIFHALAGKGVDVLLILLCLPFLQPIPLPIVSTPFGIVIALLGLRMSVRHKSILPKFLLSKSVSPNVIAKVVPKSIWLLKKLKKLIHRRMQWACHPMMRISTGIIIFISGLYMALPIPIPFSNTPVAWSVFLISLGLLEEDGLLVCIGYGIFLIGVALLILLGLHISGH